MSPLVNFLTALIGTALMATFVIGLSHSISVGFAGVIGGLPFALIVAFVLCLAVYHAWEETLKKRK